ncbi:hypothetical protein JNW90_10770 [Micromonospora sp. STR1s_5]|nr:hypothetical protein [Micromonospora sp. STR1s_5]
MGTLTRTRTHVAVTFADPHLVCVTCRQPVPQWHDPTRCGCDAAAVNLPCEHNAGVEGTCPSWGPVDGCTCLAAFGHVPHPPAPAKE